MRRLALAMLSLSFVSAVQTASAQQAAAPQPPTTPQQRVAMLKEWLAASQQQMRTYQWIETTAIAHKGEVQSTKENQCYYGVDGTLTKVPVASQESSKGGPPGVLLPGRLLKKAGEHKKEELKAYMKQAAELVHSYVPPDSNRIQAAVNGGNFSVNVVRPNVVNRLEFRNYLKQGDMLAVDVEVPTNRLMGMHISSYLDEAEDAITADVTMGLLPDGTIYTENTVLNAPSKELSVTITNSGYRKAGG